MSSSSSSSTSHPTMEKPKPVSSHETGVPSLFRQDRANLQYACLLLVCLAGSFSGFDWTLPPGILGTWSDALAELGFSLQAYTTVLAVLAATVLAAIAIVASLNPQPVASLETFPDTLRLLAQTVGDVLLTPVWAVMPGEITQLGFQQTAVNKKILEQCPTLKQFKQTPWLHNSYLSFGLLGAFDACGGPQAKKCIRRELVSAPDGGVVALDWWEPQEILTTKPKGVLYVGSTFSGDALATVHRDVCQHFTEQGWRCVVMVKRGCGILMPNTQPVAKASAQPKPWCLAGIEDTTLAIDHVANAFPGLPICGIGFSTGAGQLRDYVNRTGKNSKLAAVVCVDGAPEWEQAIISHDKRCPVIAKILAAVGTATVQACGYSALPAPKGVSKAVPGGMFEFIRDTMAPARGFEHSEAGAHEYLRSVEPASSSGCAVPCLEMVTLSDTLATPDMARKVSTFYKESPHVITALHSGGTHVIRWDGWWPRCWVSRASAEFLESALTSKAATHKKQQRKSHGHGGRGRR